MLWVNNREEYGAQTELATWYLIRSLPYSPCLHASIARDLNPADTTLISSLTSHSLQIFSPSLLQSVFSRSLNFLSSLARARSFFILQGPLLRLLRLISRGGPAAWIPLATLLSPSQASYDEDTRYAPTRLKTALAPVFQDRYTHLCFWRHLVCRPMGWPIGQWHTLRVGCNRPALNVIMWGCFPCTCALDQNCTLAPFRLLTYFLVSRPFSALSRRFYCLHVICPSDSKDIYQASICKKGSDMENIPPPLPNLNWYLTDSC